VKLLKGRKILIGPSSFSAINKAPMEHLKAAGCEIIDNPFKRKLTKPELLSLLEGGVSGLIAGLEQLDSEVLKKSKLKVISRCGSGLSNVDLSAASELGIKVCTTPYGPTQAVAELTLGAMINLLRMISKANNALHEGRWAKQIGTEISGKTVAVIGFGRIGRKVALLLRPFNVKLLAVDPAYPRGNTEGVKMVSLDEALRKADIITIHAAGESQIIGKREFELIKNGTFLLNAARGGLVDEGSLIRALEEGKIKGVWLDTFNSEPYSGSLQKYPQAILTPHMGSYTVECRKAMEMQAVNNLIDAFGRGK